MATATTKKRSTTRASQGTRRHTVVGSLDNLNLAKAGSSLTLQLFANSQKLGTLEIGRGSLFWWGNGRQKRMRVSWSRFAAMMDEIAYPKD